MRWTRAMVNAVLMATLVKPVVRRMVARWRRQAQESAATTMGIPVQELLEAALIEELTAAAADLEPSTEGTVEQSAGTSLIRTMLIAGAVIAVTAGVAFSVAALMRRRREAREAQARGSDWVAVPVDASTPEAEEAVAQESRIE